MKDMILILGYEEEQTMEIARRLRAEQVYTKIVEQEITAQQVRAYAPRGVILSGEAIGDMGTFDSAILELGIPVLALGHQSHMMLSALGGARAGDALLERKAQIEFGESMLFAGIYDGERYVKRAATLMLPTGVEEIANAAGCTIAYADRARHLYGVQLEIERNDPDSSALLLNFTRDICACSAWWTLDAAIKSAQDALAEAAAQGGHAICAVSGGVDSTLAALLAHQAFGEKMTAILVDNGLMRAGEVEDIRGTFEALGVPLECVDRSQEILAALTGMRDKDEKYTVVVGALYEEMLQRSAQIPGEKMLVLGTNYSDYLHGENFAQTYDELGHQAVEPLKDLLKEEVRAIARHLGVSAAVVDRKPFPALGLGARIVGEVTAARLAALRTAEAIFSEEIAAAGLERKLYKFFPVLIGGQECGGEMLVLRAVTLSGGMLNPARLPYDLAERTVARILAACPGMARVLYDQTPTQLGKETFE